MIESKSASSTLLNLLEYESAAKELIDPVAFDYFSSGANDEITLKENQAAFARVLLYPRMLRDVSTRSMETRVLGQKISLPVLIAPMAFQKMAHKEGELGTMQAANQSGSIMVLSTLSTCTIEEVAGQAKDNLWFQLYVYRDRGLTRSLVERAEAAGCKALVLTVDSPMLGRREKDVRNGFSLPEGLSAANLIQQGVDALPGKVGESGLAAYIASLYDQSLSWKDLEWLQSISKMPVLVKGVLRADDAKLALEHGAAGIIVSNHGGRQLDTVPATIEALPYIIEAVDGKVEVLLDGGIRRGTDVLKALALGAKAVLLGRPILWGLALRGAAGALGVLQLLAAELDLAMALAGVKKLDEISTDLLKP